jgi:putative membrane protein
MLSPPNAAPQLRAARRGINIVSLPLTEAQSAAVISEINAGEIAAAMLADTRADAAEVRAYADLMIEEHTAAQQMLTALLESESISPMPNPVSMMVNMEAMNVRTMLMTLDGAAFDRAYMQSQVTMHTDALRIIDTRLLPGATGDFRTFLTGLRAEVVQHLEMAQGILGELPVTP